MTSDTLLHSMHFFKLAKELELQFKNELIKNEVHFRPNLNSLSLISISSNKPEIGITCKTHENWSKEILNSYIQIIENKPTPKRPTPEKDLQSWIIKNALINNNSLPFDPNIKFITSELAICNNNGHKVVSDILGFDTKTNALIVIELKSDRLLKRLIEQVNNFEEVILEKRLFFENLLQLHCINNSINSVLKAIVWPYERTSPLKKLKDLEIKEYTYHKENNEYLFNTYVI